MALPQGKNPNFDTLTYNPVDLIPTSAQGAGNSVPAGSRVVKLGANVNGVTDFFVLPSLASVPNGHSIQVTAGAANCEARTPDGSDEEINSENCDGTKEYLVTATEINIFTKIDNTIGWMGRRISALGAVDGTPVVPD